jgi:ArsR family transcriptional regulator
VVTTRYLGYSSFYQDEKNNRVNTDAVQAVSPHQSGVLDGFFNFHDSRNMKSSNALACLTALAHEHRLDLFRLLVQAGSEGMTVGKLAGATGLAGATLNHHLNQLRHAGLVEDERRGRRIQCRANYARMNELLGFLTENCCVGSPADAACAGDTACRV